MATTGTGPQGTAVQIDAELFKQLRDGLGTLLLDSQASTAIVFTSALEEHLRAAMAVKMPNMNSRLEQILFEGYAPLATFKSKIDVSLALARVRAANMVNAGSATCRGVIRRSRGRATLCCVMRLPQGLVR